MHRIIPPLILLFVTAFPTVVAAQAGAPSPSDAGRTQALSGADTTPPTTAPAAVASAGDLDLLVIFEPRLRHTLVTRMTPNMRSPSTQKAPSVAVLSPPQTGYTITEQPALYWFISKPTTASVFLTVTIPEEKKTVLEKELKGVAKAGIQKFDLTGTPLRLQKNREYEWSVTVDIKPESPADNPSSSAGVMWTDLPPNVTTQPGDAAPLARAALLATHGIWYDTIAVINEEIEARPNDARLRALLEGLLLQVNLREMGGALVEVTR